LPKIPDKIFFEQNTDLYTTVPYDLIALIGV